jgi:hypothetical protein
MRDLDEIGDAILSSDPCDAFGTQRVDVLEVKVPGRGYDELRDEKRHWSDALGCIVPSDKVDNGIRVTQTLSNGLLVSNIPFLEQVQLSTHGTSGSKHTIRTI